MVFAASWPNAITYVLLSLRFLSDTYFVGQIGVNHQAALGTGYVMLIMCLSFGMGTLFAVNSIVAMSEGRRDFKPCGSATWQGIWFSVICGIGVLALYYAAPFLISLFGHDPTLAVLEVDYLRIALTSTIFQLVAWTIIHFFIATGRPFYPILIAAVTLIAHVFSGYVFTLGNFGVTEMGTVGAAWAMVFSSIVMAVTAILCFVIPRSLQKYQSRSPVLSWPLFTKVVKEGSPIGGRQVLDEFVWNVVLIWIIGQFGAIHLAAATVLISILDVFILAFDSIGMTSVALIARAIGIGKIKKADRWRGICLVVTLVYAAVAAILFYVFRVPFVSVFSESTEVKTLAVSLSFVIPIFLLIYAVYSTYDHALCATEDNHWPSIISLVSSILFLGVGGVILILYFFEAKSYGAWSLVLANIFVVAVLFAVRWKMGYWKPKTETL